MKAIGIGGAGSKLAVTFDGSASIINVSEVELNKVQTAGLRIQAALRDNAGVFQGSRMDPEIGLEAYGSVRRQLASLVKGALVFTATGGGTGNGITRGIMQDLSRADQITVEDKTLFGLILPYGRLEPEEFVSNTSNFISGPVADAIDSGNTGNIFMFSNRCKFEQRIPEGRYNQMLIDSLCDFLAVPEKNEKLQSLEGHLDQADFALFLSKPYFNHFCIFDYDSNNDFGKQLNQNQNALLLAPEQAIEALFMLEVPEGSNGDIHYNIVEYFNQQGVKPLYSVVCNPELRTPRVTVAILYSRIPAELVKNYNQVAEAHAQNKVRKTLEQHVKAEPLQVNMEDEAKKIQPEGQQDILAMLRRLNKL